MGLQRRGQCPANGNRQRTSGGELGRTNYVGEAGETVGNCTWTQWGFGIGSKPPVVCHHVTECPDADDECVDVASGMSLSRNESCMIGVDCVCSQSDSVDVPGEACHTAADCSVAGDQCFDGTSLAVTESCMTGSQCWCIDKS